MKDAIAKQTVAHDDPALEAIISDIQSGNTSEGGDPVDASLQDGSTSSDEPHAPNAPTTNQDPDDSGEQDEPTAQSDAPTPDQPQTEEDPFAGSEPFTYTANGETKTLDGVYRFPGEGLMVPEEHVPKFQLMASRAETLERSNREQYQRLQEYEKLTAWTTRDAEGKEQSLTGREAIETLRVHTGQLAASLQELTGIFKGSPLAFVTQDENGNVIWDQQALQHLATKAQLAEVNAERAIRAQVHTAFTEATRPTVPDSAQIAQLAPTVVEHYAKEFGINGLTSEEKSTLVYFATRSIRPPTSEDIQANPALANESLIVEPEFLAHLKALAARASTTQQVAKVSETATKFNNAQQSARGSKVKPATAHHNSGKSSPAAPAPKKSRSEAWAEPLEQFLTEHNIT